MKEGLRKHHGHLKTKDVLAFDAGLAEQQAQFVMVARPLLAALTALDGPGEEGKVQTLILSRITLRTHWLCWEMPMFG